MTKKKPKRHPVCDETLDILSDQAFSHSLVKSVQQVKDGRIRPSADVRKRLRISDSLAQRRLATVAKVLETDLADLCNFLDLLAEEPLTPARITDAQYVMGLCTPICSYLQFPKMSPPSFGQKLLAEWLSRQEFDRF